MADRTGQQLGNYRLARLLGRGGFAEVYLGEHVRLGTQAAIKVLYTQMGGDEAEYFLNEARTIAHLIHPHIVRTFDYDVQDGVPFLVMDYAPNGTLRQRHPKGSRVPLETIVSYIKQAVDALQYAHDEKLIHRDIKPENMLVGRRGEILLSDFGIALIAQSTRMQSTQEVVGTAYYMAPEQLQGKPRLASDQYALGVVVYEWLTGDRPFHGSFSEIASQHMFVPPPSMREKLPTLPPAVEEVVMTALAKDPHQRFGSVRAFATALEQASASAPATFVPSEFPPTVLAVPSAPPAQPQRATPSGHVLTPPGLGPITLPPTGPVISSPAMTPPYARAAAPSIKQLYTYRGHSAPVNAVAWSPDSTRIASASNDKTVQVWEATTGKNLLIYGGHSDSIWVVAWSPDGRRIASASDDRTAQVWDAVTGKNLLTYGGHSGWLRSMPINAVAWSPDGRSIASASSDQTVQVWDAATGKNLFTYRGHSGTIWFVAWSPDGRRIASASSDQTVQVWDAATGKNLFVYHGHSKAVGAVMWSPDGQRIASASKDKTVQVWDAVTGKNLLAYRGHSKAVGAVMWSPDGQRIASGSADNTVQVWNATNGSPIVSYTGHSDAVTSVAWSPDGQRIASGSADKTVQVWQAV